jgi:hypothetical protein
MNEIILQQLDGEPAVLDLAVHSRHLVVGARDVDIQSASSEAMMIMPRAMAIISSISDRPTNIGAASRFRDSGMCAHVRFPMRTMW